jgi:hypothetical protein
MVLYQQQAHGHAPWTAMVGSWGRAVNLRPAARGCHQAVNRQGCRLSHAGMRNELVFRLVSCAADGYRTWLGSPMSHVHASSSPANPAVVAATATAPPSPATAAATAAANQAAAASVQRQALQHQAAQGQSAAGAGQDRASFSAEAQQRLADEQAQGQPPSSAG